MTEDQHTKNLNQIAVDIQRLAKEAYEKLISEIGNGKEAASVAIKRVLQNYSVEVQTLVDGMMREYLSLGTPNHEPLATVNGIALSESLYATAMAVVAPNAIKIINDANSKMLTAREIAKQLYEGYDFKDDLLKVTQSLPKYLFQPIARLTASGLKTPALKAAYLQYLDKQGKQANEAQLQKLLQVAFYERNRYLANRIAQTELHRVHTDTIAAEMMADDELHWVQVKMSSTHPQYDICDYHSSLNAYGKGKGVYPKAKAPKPTFHPHCRCRLSARFDLDPPQKTPKPNNSAERAFINSLSKGDAIAILGSEAKYFEYRQNKALSVLDIVDRGKPQGYETKFLEAIASRNKSDFYNVVSSLIEDGYKVKNIPIKTAMLPVEVSEHAKTTRFAVFATDKTLRNGIRASKENRHASLPENDVLRLDEHLKKAEWFYDATKGNYLAFFDIGKNGMLGKAVIDIDYKTKHGEIHMIATTGIVDERHKNQKGYEGVVVR